ncbi:BppU family phage baseplate upper protein [Bacillus thuringiensis]|uniref:BppU family phage baseplate upper protein n=1 Tax=Bacillus thuringiensis TaxID=1428 RepID=UPI000428C0BB|nr:BppU family phage baseplate upper protein [Bacillus thuringiensis]
MLIGKCGNFIEKILDRFLEYATITVAFEKSDKSLVHQNEKIEVIDAKNGIVAVVLMTQTLAVAGDVLGEIHIKKGEL